MRIPDHPTLIHRLLDSRLKQMDGFLEGHRK
jgi:hypothetical protein